MQALNLHLEQAVAHKPPSALNLQGSKTVSQDETAFQKELQRAQKAADEVHETQRAHEMPGTTDGNQTQEITKTQEQGSKNEIRSFEGTEQPDEGSKEPEVNKVLMQDASFLNISPDEKLSSVNSSCIQLQSDNLQTDLLSAAEFEQMEGIQNEETGDDFFSIATENEVLELLPEQETYLLQDQNLSITDAASLVQQEESLLSISEDSELKSLSDENERQDELIQSLLTGQIPLNESVLQNLAENPESSKTDENTADREIIGNSENALISVIDERTVSKEAVQEGKFVTSVSYDGNGTADMSINLSQQNANTISQNGNTAASMTTNERFGEMLSSELQANAKEFVKAGSVVLKDNNSGTINLILHPEELGSVKIRLELTDKVIAGKIVVSSEEAFNAFKANLDSLRQAFTDSGFEAGGFDLSWNNESQSGQQGRDQNPRGVVYSNALPEINDDEYALQLVRDAVIYGTSVINMIA